MLVRVAHTRMEVHCHGGESAVQSIVRSLQQHGFGVREAERAYRIVHGSPWKSEFAQAASVACTERTAELILRQYLQADACLASLAAMIQQDPRNALERLSLSLRWSEFGMHLSRSWSVVFCGQPNVGKSSLMNSVVGFGRAIVHQTAGTTRDVVSQLTAIGGWPVEIKDTAGLRVAENLIERKGVELAKSEIDKADLVVVVLDATKDSETTWKELPNGDRTVFVVNKVDLLEPSQPIPGPADAIRTSAIHGEGIEDLLQVISRRLVPELPPDGLLVPVNRTQVERLQRCVERVSEDHFSEAIACLTVGTDPAS